MADYRAVFVLCGSHAFNKASPSKCTFVGCAGLPSSLSCSLLVLTALLAMCRRHITPPTTGVEYIMQRSQLFVF